MDDQLFFVYTAHHAGKKKAEAHKQRQLSKGGQKSKYCESKLSWLETPHGLGFIGFRVQGLLLE